MPRQRSAGSKRTLVDFKQVAGDLQRQSSDLQVLKRADADAMHRTHAEFLEGYPERIMKSQKLVHDKLTELSGKMDDLPGVVEILAALTRIEGEVVAALAGMVQAAKKDRKTAASEANETRALIEKAMAEPRTINAEPRTINTVVRGVRSGGGYTRTGSAWRRSARLSGGIIRP